MATTSRLLDLPPELLARIIDPLPLADRCALSAVNSQCRQFLIPAIFRAIKIKNVEKDANDLSSFLAEFGRHVEHVSFICCLAPDAEDDEEEEAAKRIQRALLPPSLQDLLTGKSLPTLRALKVSFAPEDNYEGEGWDAEELIQFRFDVESDEEVVEAEVERAWRAVVAQLWTLLAQHQALRDLEVDNHPPRKSSACWTPEWHRFCGRLEKFTLILWAGNNSAGWNINTSECYLEHISRLDRAFFAHLSSATHVTFRPDSQNPVGCTGMHHTPLPFPPDAMPALHTLELWSCFLDPALLAFLKAHASQLRTLRLRDCLAAGTNMAENPLTWTEFLAAFHGADPRLTTLSIVNTKAPLTESEEFATVSPEEPESESEDVRAVRAALAADARRRLFPYVTLDDKYGMMLHDREDNASHFLDGADQRAYDALREKVAENRAANGLDGEGEGDEIEVIEAVKRAIHESEVRFGHVEPKEDDDNAGK